MASDNQQGVKRKAEVDIDGAKPEKKQEVESKDQPSLQQLEDDARREYEALKANPEYTKKNYQKSDGYKNALSVAHIKYLLACHKNGKDSHGPTWSFKQLTSKLLTAAETNIEVEWLYYITCRVQGAVQAQKTRLLVLSYAEIELTSQEKAKKSKEGLLLLAPLRAEKDVIEEYSDCVLARMEELIADQLDIPLKEGYKRRREDYQDSFLTENVSANSRKRHRENDLLYSAMSVANGFSAECLIGCECKGLKKKSKDETLCFVCLSDRYYYDSPFLAMSTLREHSGLSYRQKMKLITDPICKPCYKRGLFCCQGDCKLANECEECERD